MHPKKVGPGLLRPALVGYVVLTVRVSHPPHAMPHSGGALPSLSTKVILSLLLACNSRLANAGPTAIISVGRLGNDCRIDGRLQVLGLAGLERRYWASSIPSE